MKKPVATVAEKALQKIKAPGRVAKAKTWLSGAAFGAMVVSLGPWVGGGLYVGARVFWWLVKHKAASGKKAAAQTGQAATKKPSWQETLDTLKDDHEL
jgi:hypothetical protein